MPSTTSTKTTVTASQLIAQAISWLGATEGSATHHTIVDTYNTISPLPRSYKMTYTDAWCATFVSACFQKLGAISLINGGECGCQELINANTSAWIEDDNYTPAPGDLIFYDWQDSGSGDNTGWADHVGIVEKVTGSSTITVIEGNSSDTVRRVTRTVGQQYIRGYISPSYALEPEATTTTYYFVTDDPTTTIFTTLDAAKLRAIAAKKNVYTQDGTLVYQYQAPAQTDRYFAPTTALFMREGPGSSYQYICVIPQGKKCKYLAEQGNWYQLTYNNKTGWASKKYLSEVK